MEVRYVDYGIANNFGSHIELNRNLKAYPELHNSILEHEMAHSKEPGFTKKDFLLDLGPSHVNYWKLFKFMCTFPKTFLQFAPFYWQKIEGKRTFIYDINLIIVWVTLLTIVSGTIIFSSYL
jgi:hypothetical protein